MQPSPSLMSVYPAIYPCVYLSDSLLDIAYLHAGYSFCVPRNGARLAAELQVPKSLTFLHFKHTNFSGRIKAAVYRSPKRLWN